MATESLRRFLAEPVDAASSAAFRIAFGAVMLFSAARFAASGWIDAFYVAPRYHFTWSGFEWLAPWPAWGLYLHFAVLGLAALGVMLGLFYRASAAVFLVAFSCIELFDETYYLNHYYLVSLLAGLAVCLPLHRSTTVPRWVPLLLRTQLGVVYFFAGVAKLDADWLLRAEPLAGWLGVHRDLPLVGPLLALPATAFAASWASALFDLCVAFALCARRTRGLAYAAVIAFHVATALLFPIGVFPWLMIALTPVFFAPDWPRRALARFRSSPTSTRAPASHPASHYAARPLPAATFALLTLYVAAQLLLPLRHVLYPGPVNWTEEGFRFAWRVMLIEKTGHVDFHVRDPRSGRSWQVSARDELTERQLAMMSTQPDMIAQYARHLADDFAARGHHGVEVRADAWASLNGRPAQRLIDPSADLAQPQPPLAPAAYVVRLLDPAPRASTFASVRR